jgi:hypothetical protein
MVQKMVRKMVVVVLIMVIMVMVNAPAFKSLSLTCSAVQVSTSGDEFFLCLNVNQCFRDKPSPFSSPSSSFPISISCSFRYQAKEQHYAASKAGRVAPNF